MWLQTGRNRNTFGVLLQRMKAVFQNTLFGVLCLASVVWAAPTQTVPHSKMLVAEPERFCDQTAPAVKQQGQQAASGQELPSLVEGTIRFACW